MKVSITKNELQHALSVVSKGMSSRSTLPILSGILMVAHEKQLVFQTTDLENSFKSSSAAFIEEDGQTVVPGKLFWDIVKTLPDAAIQLTTTNNNQIKIECLNSSFSLNTLNAEDFPRFPEIESSQEITLPVARLSSMVQQVLRAVSKDEHRVILTGILISVHENTVTLVATDSYRLSISEIILSSPVVDAFEVIVPGRLFGEIIKNASSDGEISIGVTDNQIIFMFDNNVFITRKIEGTYPNYKQLLPSETGTSAVVDTEALIATIKRMSLLAQSNSSIKFMFSSEKHNIHISAQTQDVGESSEYIEADIEGEDVEIAFNHQFVLDGLSTIPSEKTLIELQTSKKPGIFKSTGKDNYLYLAMPVRLG